MMGISRLKNKGIMTKKVIFKYITARLYNISNNYCISKNFIISKKRFYY